MELAINGALNVLALQPLHASQAPGDLDTTPSTAAPTTTPVPQATTTTPTATRVPRRGRRAHDPNQDVVAPRARNTRRPSRRV